MIDNSNRWQLIIKSERYMQILSQIQQLEFSRPFCKHGLDHSLEVARVIYIINLEKNLGISKDLIYTTGLLHDIGRAEQYHSGIRHEQAGAEIAEQILVECGYSNEDIELVCGAIKDHNKEITDYEAVSLGDLLRIADKCSRSCVCCEASNDCYWPDELKSNNPQY